MRLADRIREARGDLTQRQLAERLGLDPITVSRYERGVLEPSVQRVREIAAATDKPLSFFFDGVAA